MILRSEKKRFKRESLGCQTKPLNEEHPSENVDPGNSSVSAAMAALDNHLILQEIFKFLSPGDLRACCQVNEKWKAIAGPMIFEYHLHAECTKGSYKITVKTTKGYLNPQIEERGFSPEAETEYIESLKRGISFMSLEFRGGTSWTGQDHDRNPGALEFVRKFGSRFYKLRCSDHNFLYKFFREKPYTQDLQLLPYLPNCEEYCLDKLRTLAWFSDVKMPKEMDHLRKVHLGSILGGQWCLLKFFPTETPTVLQMAPNLQHIHGVPFSMVGHFEKVNKIHLIRSIHFHAGLDENLEMESMKRLVQLGMKFKFLRIGRNKGQTKEGFLKRNKQHFEDLLEIGKDTLQHIVIHSIDLKTSENHINFPATMTALTHITLKKQCYESLPPLVHFPKDFNFSDHFPNLNTISFVHISLAEWKRGDSSWWGSKGKPISEEFLMGIRNLRCHSRSLPDAVEQKLLQRFPSVNRIEYVRNIDVIDVDGIVSD